MTYALFGKFTAKPGERDDLLAVLTESAEALQPDAGCLHFLVGAAADEADAVLIWEAWTDKAAHDAAVARPEVAALMERGGQHLGGAFDSWVLTDAVGKGLPA